MSGIAGILRFDSEAIERRDLERAANALRAYGPDRRDILAAGSVGLVHALMRMTPEDQFDRQPWRAASGAVIGADVRLDNRDDLLVRLGITPADAMTWADARVVLTAWEKYGNDLWPMLRGPFAIAIWDPRQNVLVLARDQLGLGVAVWHKNERFFAFATAPKGLFALAEVPRRLSEKKFADFMVLNHADHATTMYEGIYRVRPAHVLSVRADGRMEERRYWSASGIKPVRLTSDEAYAEGLRECLDRAVRRQLRSVHPVGCYLSGGLDSSSVAVLAARALGERNQRLAAFTHVPRAGFEGPVPEGLYADETPYVEAIRKLSGNIDITYVRNDEYDDFADLERMFIALEGPVRNPTNLGWMLAIPRLARAQGCRVLLGGLLGNLTISWNGWSQTAGHLVRGRLLTAFQQWRIYYRRSPDSRWKALQKQIVEPLLPDSLSNWLHRRRHPGRVAPWQAHAAIRPKFAAEMDVAARAREAGHDFFYRMRPHERLATLGGVDYLGDWFAAQQAVTGVEMRDPTADLDVVSFCFGIPPEQYLIEDIDRSLVRRAMWGLLPVSVATKRARGLQSPDWFEKLERRRATLAQEITDLSASPSARRAIDLDRLARAIENWPTGGWDKEEIIEEYQLAFTRGIAGARFLRWMESVND
jgi:asparagine synthase (glutamine-hydrolysing)